MNAPLRIRIPALGWKPRHYQMEAWNAWEQGCKRQLLFWHRRAGKDEIDLQKHAVSAMTRPGTYWHMLPEAAQARKAIWNAVNPHSGKRRIEEVFPDEIVANRNDNEMFIRFVTGSTFQVVGSDNFNSLVGSPPVGITFSEWALANPSAWAFLSPILEENGGWASFITTPRGNNHAKTMLDAAKLDPWNPALNPKGWFSQVLTAAQTGAIDGEGIEKQRKVYAALYGSDVADLLIKQEYYCSFAGALVGSYWASEIDAAEVDGRFRVVAIDDRYPVHTAWDLGKAVNNPIWCFQIIPGEQGPRIVDFYKPDSEDLEDWCKWLNDKGYQGNDYVPHDIMHPVWGTKRTRYEILKAAGRKPKMVGMTSVADGITAGRETIKVAVFHDSEDERGKRVEQGVDGLKAYRRVWDDERKTYLTNAYKNWAEHIGSSFRYLGLAWREEQLVVVPPPKTADPVYTATAGGVIMGNMTVKEAVEAMVRRKRRAS
jgi:phage terminase large subunit